jgi:hypothetical protein
MTSALLTAPVTAATIRQAIKCQIWMVLLQLLMQPLMLGRICRQ